MTGLYGVARRLRGAGYLLATCIAVSSISDVVASNWPIAVHEARWRIGVTTVIAGVTPLNLVAIFLSMTLGELRLLLAAAVSLAFSFAAFRVRRHASNAIVEAAPAHASRFFMGNVASPGARIGTLDEG